MEDKKDQIVASMGSAIWDQFRPANSIYDATHRWTTTEIATAITQHTGVLVDNQALYDVLCENGFKYVIDETVIAAKFVWLLKIK